MKNTKHFNLILILLLLFGASVFAQDDVRELKPNQTIEREMTGKETHRYKFDLKQDEFFQVRVEQKGVDVLLKLLDADGKVLATMDSPNGTEGFEILTFIPTNDGSFIFESISLDEKAPKGQYIIKREKSRPSNDNDKKRVEIEKVFNDGISLRGKGQYEDSLLLLEKALIGWQELNDKYFYDLTKEQLDFINIIILDLRFFAKIDAIHQLEQETRIIHEKGTPESLIEARNNYFEVIKLYDEFIVEMSSREFSKLVQGSTLKADYLLNAKWGRLNNFGGISNTYMEVSEAKERLEYLNLAINEADDILSNKEIQSSRYFADSSKIIINQKAVTLLSKATHLNQHNLKPETALNSANQALELFKKIKEEKLRNETEINFQIARTYQTLGSIYLKNDDYSNSIINLEKSLTIIQTIPNGKLFESEILKNLALAYFQSFNYQKTLEIMGEALKIAQESNDKYSEVEILGYISIIYYDLGDEEKVRETAKQQIPILLSDEYVNSIKRNLNSLLQNIPIQNSESNNTNNKKDHSLGQLGTYEILRLMSLGRNYLVLKEFENSLKYYNQALKLAQSEKDISLESSILSNIGDIYIKQNNPKQAISYLKKSADIEKTLTQKSYYATALRDIGFAYLEAKMPNDAVQYLTKSLSVWESIKSDNQATIYRQYATTLAHTARAYQETGNSRMAILFGKLTVNATQIERERLKEFDKKLQKSYLDKNDKPYRRLADILIAQGRIAEAEQVLDMLKEEEYFSYLRRDANVVNKLDARVSLTSDEEQAFADYEKFAEAITKAAEDLGELEKKKNALGLGESLSKEDQKRYDELKKIYDEATAKFDKFLDELKVKFGKEDKRVANVESALKAMLNRLNQPRTVIISTIAGEDRLNLILTTSDIQKAYTVNISVADLNKLVADFREDVKNPNADPRASGKKLYDKLFPLEMQKELAAIKTDTIIWSLDGTLRYVPMAALFDGKQYLVERYNQAVITLASRQRLEEESKTKREDWKAFGVGVSKSFENFNALPAVPKELCSVVKDAKKKDFCDKLNSNGVFEGLLYSDEDFTMKNFEDNIGKVSVVHIASHFDLKPGNDNDSFLLVGGIDNRKYSVERFSKLNENSLQRIELLTLSACNTAMSASEKSNGVEIEGFGALAQNKGVKSVLATLWAVNDDSTGFLMTEFYKILDENPSKGKAEALRQAQLKLIQGEHKTLAESTRRGVETFGDENKTEQIKFEKDDKAPFKHPYFWSPFVLSGNWK